MFRKYPPYGSDRPRNDQNGTIQQHSSHMEYEEIESYVECPTCQGAGRISKESEAEYVALIPLTDKRLRPRRTYMYVGITFAVCILIIVLLVIFLTPRSITLNNDRRYIEPSVSIVDEDGKGEYAKVYMQLTNRVNLTNGNYFRITVSQLEMSISMGDIIVETVTQHPNAGVGILGRRELAVKTNVTLNNPSLKITSYCVYDDYILRTLYMRFQFTVTVTYNGQHMEATYSAVQGVDCYPTANKTTTRPPRISTDRTLDKKIKR